MANIKDGATGTVLTAPSPQSSGTTLVLNSGEGARFPAPPFWAIAGPNNGLPLVSVAEKILVTGVSTDTFTIVRAPFGPYTAKNIDVGWRISNAIFQDDFNNASIVTNEVPAGLVNGSNTTYTLASTVHTTGSLEVFADGLHLKGGGNDYTETATGFTTTTAYPTGTLFIVNYIVTGAIQNVGTNSLITDETPAGTVNGATVLFTAARAYIGGSLELHINGIKQKRGVHFAETNPALGTFTISDAPITGDDVMINYAFNLNPSSNSDTVDGYNASATPTANMIPVLDSNGKMPESTNSVPHFVSKRMSGATTVSSTATTIAFDTVDITSGTKITATGNTIVIGTGVSVVEISYNLMSDSGGSASYLYSRIRKNGVDISQQIDAAANQFRSTSETRRASVASGDVLTIIADSGTNTLSVARNSSFQVEVIL